MAVAFACPECGERIRVAETATARRVRCEECLTLVEVPFFPRAARPRRRRGQGWWYVAIATALAVIAVGATYLLARARIREDRARAIRGLVASAEADERRGEWARALERLDQALALVASDASQAGDAGGLRARREAAAERLERARRDEAIATARAEVEAARRAAGASPPEPARALALAESAFARVRPVPDPRADGVAEEASRLAAGLVAARGVVFEPVGGASLGGPGPATAHAGRLFPILASALEARGYLPRLGPSPLAELWGEHAPFRVATTVDESHGPGYLSPANPNRTARLSATVRLLRGDGASPPIWQARATGKTRTPAPTLNAFASGYIAAGTRRDPEVERKLYADAVVDLSEDLGRKVGNLPACSPVADP
jgi:hypothetical protein